MATALPNDTPNDGLRKLVAHAERHIRSCQPHPRRADDGELVVSDLHAVPSVCAIQRW